MERNELSGTRRHHSQINATAEEDMSFRNIIFILRDDGVRPIEPIPLYLAFQRSRLPNSRKWAIRADDQFRRIDASLSSFPEFNSLRALRRAAGHKLSQMIEA
jgi:hypothetical protein